VRYLRPDDSLRLPYDGGKNINVYLYTGRDWLPMQNTTIIGVPMATIRGLFLHISDPYNPVQGPFPLQINPNDRGPGKIVGYARFSGKNTIRCSPWY
jgi:hypothetical protein